MRSISKDEFTKAYDKVTSSQDYMSDVKRMEIGDTIAIPATNKEHAIKMRHNIVQTSSNLRKRGGTVKFQTLIKEILGDTFEVWIARVS